MIGGFAVSCGVVPRSSQPPAITTGDTNPARTGERNPSSSAEDDTASSDQESSAPNAAMAVSSLNEAKASLIQAYRDWKGTPYVLGGASQEGVDCSRFVNIVFDDYFGIDLPTNTREQLNVGNGIRRAAVRTGDLVFFRTGRKTLHVGIAVNSGEFLHASTSNGVMISKLGKSYWRNRFLAARRVL
ncbi:NlpC/P60 family protein [Fodinibius sp. AD559]|uniref:NlpC/P60 family protein n=1 Tax=Fodinibius sp. AD559 TaxID=3424179 RepID=UPI004046BAD5